MKRALEQLISVYIHEVDHDLDKRRVIFCKQHITTEFWDMLNTVGRIGRADGLDTVVPYGIHTTSQDMLRNFMPFASYSGVNMQSRVGYDILHAAGLNFLATDNHSGYVTKVLEYVQSKAQ